MAVELNGTMVYPQMFPVGDGPFEGGSQEEQGRHEESLLQQQRSEIMRQHEQLQRQQQALQGGVSPNLGPAGAGMMNTNSMLAAGISPAVIDAHQRRTQSILNAAIVAANQAGDARAGAASLQGMASGGMGASGFGGGGGGGMGPPGMGGGGMGFGSGMPSFNRPGGFGGGFGQNFSQQEAASLLQNRYASLGAGLPTSLMGGGMSGAPSAMGGMGEASMSAPPSKRKSEKKKKASVSAAPKRAAKKRAKTFPEKLMQAMTDSPNDDAVAWLPDGKSFVVVNPEDFVETVLKKAFKGCKYSSFVRKLHRWGFVRLTSGTGTDCFHHPLFQKNRGDLCVMISCSPRDPKETGPAAAVARNEKPPSLAGVEKFIQAKAAAAAAAASDAASAPVPQDSGAEDSAASEDK